MDSLIALIISNLIGLGLISSHARLQEQGYDNQLQANTAGEFQDLLASSRNYVNSNYGALTAQIPVGGTTEIPLGNLALLPNFSSLNPYGQTWHVYIQQPSSGQLSAFVFTTGGQFLPLPVLTNVASLSGSHGGYVGQDNTLPGMSSQIAIGASGGWRLPLAGLPNPGSGHLFGLASGVAGAQYNSDALYRDAVPNHPELSKMNTTLNMGGNDITSVGNEQVGKNLQVGNGISAHSITLDAGNNLTEGNATFYGDGSNAAIRAPDQVFIQHPDGSLAPVSASALRLPSGNNLTEGSASFYGDDTNAAVRTPGQVLFQHQDGSSAPITASTANVTTGVQYSPTAALGASCGQPGLTTGRNDGSGEILSCTRGIWQSLTFKQFYSYLPPTTTGFAGYASANPATGSYSCQAGTADTYGATFWYGDYGYSTLHICQPQ